MLRGDVREVVDALRADAVDAHDPYDAYRIGRRLGQPVRRTLDPLPWDSRCLMRSLVLLRMLARRGVVCRLVIGVRPAGELRGARLDRARRAPAAAHTWVRAADRALRTPRNSRENWRTCSWLDAPRNGNVQRYGKRASCPRRSRRGSEAIFSSDCCSSPVRGCLQPEELRVAPALRDELVVGSLLDDLAVVQDVDPVGGLHGREAVRDQQHRPAVCQRLHVLEQLMLRARVERRGRLVEDQQPRLAEERAREGDALPLAERQVVPAGELLAEDGLVAVR